MSEETNLTNEEVTVGEVSSTEEKEKTTYIASKAIKDMAINDLFVTTTFEDDTTFTFHGALLSLLQTDEPGNGEPEELLYLMVAKKLLNILTEYNLRLRDFDEVQRYMGNLVSNSHTDATRKLWNDTSMTNITLQQIEDVLKSK